VKKHLYRAYAKLGVENRLQVINLLLLKNAIESGSISDILRSAATRAVAFAASVALALAEAMSDWDLTFDFLSGASLRVLRSCLSLREAIWKRTRVSPHY